MKLAIHNEGSWNAKWIEYCIKSNIEYLPLDCYDTNIIQILKDNEITHLMWHFHHSKPKDILMARNVLYSANKMGVKTFPNFETAWHFDDKVSQKYLLEAVDAPLVPSYAFYDKVEALTWLRNQAKYPIVAKLRRGAGSYNVELIRDYNQAKKYTCKMFGSGVNPTPGYIADVKNKLKVAGGFSGIKKRLKKAPNYFKMVFQGKKLFPKEKGYVYFQKFVPNNKCDYRIKVVGDKCWGFRRFVRENDFRASGSGIIDLDHKSIPFEMIKIAFECSEKVNMQSVAFDFVIDEENKPLIVEISYGFGIDDNETDWYWNREFTLLKGGFNPEDLILENFIK